MQPPFLNISKNAMSWGVALLWGGGGVQGFRLKSRDFGQPVQGSALSRLASMNLSLRSCLAGPPIRL